MSYFHRFRFSAKRYWACGGCEIEAQADSAVGGIHLFGPLKLGLNIVKLSNSQIVFGFSLVSATFSFASALARTGNQLRHTNHMHVLVAQLGRQRLLYRAIVAEAN